MSIKDLRINEKLSWRDVNGELVALDVVTGEYHVFNDIGRNIWLSIAENKKDLNTLANEILGEYDATFDQIISDIQAFIADLIGRGMLTKETTE